MCRCCVWHSILKTDFRSSLKGAKEKIRTEFIVAQQKEAGVPEASTEHTCAPTPVSSHQLWEASGNTFEYLYKAGLIRFLLQ